MDGHFNTVGFFFLFVFDLRQSYRWPLSVTIKSPVNGIVEKCIVAPGDEPLMSSNLMDISVVDEQNTNLRVKVEGAPTMLSWMSLAMVSPVVIGSGAVALSGLGFVSPSVAGACVSVAMTSCAGVLCAWSGSTMGLAFANYKRGGDGVASSGDNVARLSFALPPIALTSLSWILPSPEQGLQAMMLAWALQIGASFALERKSLVPHWYQTHQLWTGGTMLVFLSLTLWVMAEDRPTGNHQHDST